MLVTYKIPEQEKTAEVQAPFCSKDGNEYMCLFENRSIMRVLLFKNSASIMTETTEEMFYDCHLSQIMTRKQISVEEFEQVAHKARELMQKITTSPLIQDIA